MQIIERLKRAIESGFPVVLSQDDLRELAAVVPELEPAFGSPGPARLPTQAPLQRSSASTERAALLSAWLRSYGGTLGLMPHPDHPGTRELLDALRGKGATPEKLTRAADEMARQRWWENKGYRKPGLDHFARRFDSYWLDACERDGLETSEADRRAAELERKNAERAAQMRVKQAELSGEELSESVRQLMDSLGGKRT